MKTKKMLRCLILFAMVVGVSSVAFGYDPNSPLLWDGTGNGIDWFDAANWNQNAVPDPNFQVEIGDPNYVIRGGTYPITVSVAAAANADSLKVGAGIMLGQASTLTISAGGSLTTGGDITIADSNSTGTLTVPSGGGPITVGDDLSVGDNGDGTFNMTGGTLSVSDNIRVSKDDYGTGTMTLIGVVVDCDDLYVASEGDDETGTGVGTVTLTNCDVVIDDGDLRIGRYGTGTVTATGGTLEVHDDVEIASGGKGGTGTLTLNSTDIPDYSDKLLVGIDPNNSKGELIMNGTSEIETGNNVNIGGDDGTNDGKEITSNGVGIVRMNDDAYLIAGDQMRIGSAIGSTGTLYMNDPNTVLETIESEDLKVGQWGSGTIVTYGTIIVDDDLYVGKKDGGTGVITMSDPNAVLDVDDDMVIGGEGYGKLDMTAGGSVTVGNNFRVAQGDSGDGDVIMNGGRIWIDGSIDFASHGDISGSDPVANLTMRNGALFATQDNDFNFAKKGSGELRMMSGAILHAGFGYAGEGNGDDIKIGEDSGSYAYVEIDDSSTRLFCDNLELGRDGGSVDFDIERARIEIDDDFLVADDITDDEGTPGIVDVVIDKNAYINIDNKCRIGGNGAQVTITLLDGDINMHAGSDALELPASDSEGGYAVIVLGKDADGISLGQAKFELDGPLDANDVGDNDYIDFLGGGLLEMQTSNITEQAIKDHIVSGYFRTTYSQAALNGDSPGAGECFRPVYVDKGDGRWHVYLGVGSICVDPPAVDYDGDCDVDFDDLVLLAEDWDTKDLQDFAELAANWQESVGQAYGQ